MPERVQQVVDERRRATKRVDDLEAALDAVSKAGGLISRPIFAFPGGRRFHFVDPSGSELAVWAAA